MKKLAIFLIVVFVLGIVFFLNRDVVLATSSDLLYASPCETPKPYSIGEIDPEFQISESSVKEAVKEASRIWGNEYGKPLFVYDPNSAFTIQLLYDTRQSLNTEIGHLNDELKEKDNSLKPEIDEYNRKSDELQTKIRALNAEIASWNEKGGAPEDVYNGLKRDQNTLRREAESLNAWADSLSISTKDLNETVDHLKETVSTYNEALTHKPEGGKYIMDDDGERIEINIFDSKNELENILAHELGHSLGMDHVSDEQAIMFSKTNGKLVPTASDLLQLQKACTKKNVLRMKFTEFSYALHTTIHTILPKSFSFGF